MATILNLELDLPLAETPASRFLAWIAGALVFLAVLALALASAAGGTVHRLALEPQIVTVALPAGAGADSPDAATAGVMADLERLEGVAYVRVVPPDEVGRMIEPWLTTDTGLAGLPLPRLLDVAFNAGRAPDLAALQARIAALAPGAMVDEVARSGDGTAPTARVLRTLGYGAVTLLLALLVLVVIAVTRMSSRSAPGNRRPAAADGRR